MTIYFTKNDDLILFHFNMKNLNMVSFLHIKMRKIYFEIIRHHCFFLAKMRNLQTCVCFYLNKAFIEAFSGVFRTQSNI